MATAATAATAATDRADRDADLVDAQLGALLDAVDERTAAQNRLNDELGAGFLWLARERYRDALAIERLGEVARDERDMQTHQRVDVHVESDGNVVWTRDTGATGAGGTVSNTSAPGLRRRRGAAAETEADSGGGDGGKTASRRGRSRYVGIPSKEVREAVSSFERAVDAAIALAGVQARVAATVGETMAAGETEGEGTT